MTTWKFQPLPQPLGLTLKFINTILHIWFQLQMKESPDLWHILLTMYVVVTVILNGSVLWKHHVLTNGTDLGALLINTKH